MALPSITGEILTSKVNVGYADKLWSTERQDQNQMMCPMWGGYDLTGRQVCADSFYTKNEGCNTAIDRINVENDQRPRYVNFVTLSAEGIGGALYTPNAGMVSADAEYKMLKDQKYPEFGNLSGARLPTTTSIPSTINGTPSPSPSRAALAQANRNLQANNIANNVQSMKYAAGTSGNNYRQMYSYNS